MKNLLSYNIFEDVNSGDLCGPLYHGTTKDKLESILSNGFKISVPKNVKDIGDHPMHSYEAAYSPDRESDENMFGRVGINEPPLHIFGFGVYLTRYKTAALNRYSWRNNTPPNREILNVRWYIDAAPSEVRFVKPEKMWAWWEAHGYNYRELISGMEDKIQRGVSDNAASKGSIRVDESLSQLILDKRLEATINMTNKLKSKYDLIEYVPKNGIDSAQLCCYRPELITTEDKIK